MYSVDLFCRTLNHSSSWNTCPFTPLINKNVHNCVYWCKVTEHAVFDYTLTPLIHCYLVYNSNLPALVFQVQSSSARMDHRQKRARHKGGRLYHFFVFTDVVWAPEWNPHVNRRKRVKLNFRSEWMNTVLDKSHPAVDRMMEQHQMQQVHKERERRTSGSGEP